MWGLDLEEVLLFFCVCVCVPATVRGGDTSRDKLKREKDGVLFVCRIAKVLFSRT